MSLSTLNSVFALPGILDSSHWSISSIFLQVLSIVPLSIIGGQPHTYSHKNVNIIISFTQIVKINWIPFSSKKFNLRFFFLISFHVYLFCKCYNHPLVPLCRARKREVVNVKWPHKLKLNC